MDVPIACSLTASAARSQLGEWRTIVATAVDTVERGSPTELSFRLRADLAGLTDFVLLAQREQACCPFFDFTLRITKDANTLLISVPPDAAPVLDTFADLAPAAGSGGLGGRAVAVQGALVVGAGGGEAAVGVQGDRPAPAVHGDEVVKSAEQDRVGQAGGATFAARHDVMHLAGGGWL